jgi:hypothetical protein
MKYALVFVLGVLVGLLPTGYVVRKQAELIDDMYLTLKRTTELLKQYDDIHREFYDAVVEYHDTVSSYFPDELFINDEP